LSSQIAPGPATDLTAEIQRLKDDLRDAESALITPADKAVAQIRDLLKAKEQVLASEQEAEGQAIAAQQYAQQLEALHQIEADEAKAKAELDVLRTEQARLPEKIYRAQFHHSQLCRLRAEMKKQLGL
jgi:hypothetical protein